MRARISFTGRTVLYQLRLNGRDAALHVVRQAADEPIRRLMQPCLEGAQGAALDAPVAEFVQHWQRSEDPETPTRSRPCWSFAAVRRTRCVSWSAAWTATTVRIPALDLDPIWAGLRADPEFQRIRTKAKACHDRFRRMVEAYDGPSNH